MENIHYLCRNNMDNCTHHKNMKKLKFLLLISLVAMASCTSYKKVPYLQNSKEIDTTLVSELYDARIQPKDLLTITVCSEKPEAAIPFNLSIPGAMGSSNETFLVDNDGHINFPTLGKLEVAGMTKGELEGYIQERIKSNFTSEPIVTVRMANYKITVLGEVNSPGVKTIENEKVNILEAVAMAGDLSIFGKRDNIKLIRENTDGTKKIVELNLNDANIIHSPYYYLQQNDILYVEPNKAKARSADMSTMTTTWISATSLLLTVANFLLNLF